MDQSPKKESMSPTPYKTKEGVPEILGLKEHTFFDALSEISSDDKKKMHKLEWKETAYYGHFVNEVLMLHKPDDKDYQWVLSLGDVLGEDYVIL